MVVKFILLFHIYKKYDEQHFKLQVKPHKNNLLALFLIVACKPEPF